MLELAVNPFGKLGDAGGAALSACSRTHSAQAHIATPADPGDAHGDAGVPVLPGRTVRHLWRQHAGGAPQAALHDRAARAGDRCGGPGGRRNGRRLAGRHVRGPGAAVRLLPPRRRVAGQQQGGTLRVAMPLVTICMLVCQFGPAHTKPFAQTISLASGLFC